MRARRRSYAPVLGALGVLGVGMVWAAPAPATAQAPQLALATGTSSTSSAHQASHVVTAPSVDTASTALVLGRARGSVVAWHGVHAATAERGAVIHAGGALEVSGWCELWTPREGRVRLSAAARVEVGADRLRVERGRAWVQLPAAVQAYDLELVLGDWRVRVPSGSSVVVEESASAGAIVAVRHGRAEVHAPGVAAPLVVRPGEVARGEPPSVRTGGAALLELVASEAREGLGDPTRLHAYLVEQSRRAPLGPLDTRALGELPRLDAELAGADGGSAGLTLEEALRPPPFFEREVPTKGPNLEIVVEFEP
jgi:hypothetical protein